MRETRKHVMTILIPGTTVKVRYPLIVKNAKQNISIERIDLDAYNGKPGSVVECMNAQCGHRNKDKFPHPFYFIEITRSRAFVVDKVNAMGHPVSCVRYDVAHRDANETREFDTPGGKTRMIKEGRIRRTIHFLIPRKKNFNTKPHKSVPLTDADREKRSMLKVPRGSLGRAFVAGLIPSYLVPSTK